METIVALPGYGLYWQGAPIFFDLEDLSVSLPIAVVDTPHTIVKKTPQKKAPRITCRAILIVPAKAFLNESLWFSNHLVIVASFLEPGAAFPNSKADPL
jgi:hypothetical protein